MSSLLVSLADMQVVQLEVRAAPEDWMGFTHLQVFRSVVGQDGPFEELSSRWWMSAMLPEDGGSPMAGDGLTYDVGGKTLQVLVDQQVAQTVQFVGQGGLTAAQCAAQITGGNVAAWVGTGGRLVLSSLRPGGQASLCASGDAAALFGFPSGQVVFGKDPRPVLSAGITTYQFRDYFGQPGYFYKTRFINDLTGATSAYSPVQQGGAGGDLAPSALAVGYLRCVNSAGKAQRNAKAIVHTEPQLSALEGRLVTATPQEKFTDERGYVEFALMRGLKVTVIVPEMGLVRSITVPDEPLFNLLAPGIGKDDPFDVRRIAISHGERRTF